MKHKFYSIVTNDVAKLSEFYKAVLQPETIGINDTANYVELNIEDFVVCVENVASVQKRSGVSFPAKPIFIEFEVDNADEQYSRLKQLGVDAFSEPFDNPWGTRNFYFHDPDGNLVCFYMTLNKSKL